MSNHHCRPAPFPHYELSPLERLCLRAGQLAFPGPGKEIRAVGLALTMLVDQPGDFGLIGEGRIPASDTIQAVANEIIDDLNFTGRRMFDALATLMVSGFLDCDHLEVGERYCIRPTTLPQRRTHPDDQRAIGRLLMDGVEVDPYGFGAL